MAAAMLFPVDCHAISAKKAALLDVSSGRMLYENYAQDKSLIASTTKIMTALVICEQCNVLDRVRIPKEAVGVEGSSIYLQEGEVLTVQELLYGLMLHSGNDAATALAIYCGGNLEGFVEMMNDKARALGLDGTHFSNPHGLDAPGHYSCAADLAKLSAYAMSNPIFAMTVSTKTVTVGQRHLRNHNKLLWRIEGADGVKTGYTKAAGRILVSSVSRQGRRLVCVTIDAPDDWNDHAKLLESAFHDYKPTCLIQAGQILGFVSVAGGDAGSVSLVAKDGFVYSLAEGENVTVELPGIGYVYAPTKCNDSAGVAHILVNDKPVGSVELVFGETISAPREQKKSFLERILGR